AMCTRLPDGPRPSRRKSSCSAKTIGPPLAGNLDRAFGEDGQRAGLTGAVGGGGTSGSMRVVAPGDGCRRHRRVDAKPDTGNSSGYANTVISEIATPDSPRTTNPKLRYMLSAQALR